MTEPLLARYKGTFSQGRDVQQIIDWVQGIPPMPAVAARAMRLIDDPNCSAHEIANVLRHDAALASQILRAGNSAAAARSEHVDKLEEAVQVVGFRYVKGIVMASVTRRWNPDFSPMARGVWERSIGTASATRILLTRLGRSDPDQFFLAGLLHNLGQVVMLSHPEVGKSFPRILKLIAAKSVTFSHAESEAIGFSHPLVGALVAQKWGFPVELCRSILYYDDPPDSVAVHDSGACVTLKLASLLCLSAGIGTVPCYPIPPVEMQNLAKQLGFPEGCLDEELRRITALTKSEFVTESSLYA